MLRIHFWTTLYSEIYTHVAGPQNTAFSLPHVVSKQLKKVQKLKFKIVTS